MTATVEASRLARWRTIWRERYGKVKDAALNVGRAFSLVWQGHPPSALGMAASTLVGAFTPVAQVWVAKLIVDTVVDSINAQVGAQAGLRAVAPYLMAEFVLFLVNAANQQARDYAEHVLHAQINLGLNSRIIRKALALDLSHFENAEYYDKLENARREADWRSLQIVNNGFYLIQNLITLLSYSALLLTFSPLLALILFLATIPAFIVQNRFSELNFRVLSWRAPEARRLHYLEYLLTNLDAVKEVKLFGLGEPLLQRYEGLFASFLDEDRAIAWRRSLASLGWGMLTSLSYYAAYAWIVFRAVSGVITLGDMTLYIGVFRGSQGMFQGILRGINSLYENGLFMSNLFAFLELEPQMALATQPRPAPRNFRTIEFRNVAFRYPGQEDWALQNVNLTIHAGEKIALVGMNGAGKTTLIKLLTRLYDPIAGQILVDDIDLREYDLASWRQQIGVIFQDFVRYHLSASENIGFGQVEALGDQARIAGAAHKSGADSVIDGLPEGYETMLGRWFRSGRELSGGEWQKVALARAFMRDCQLLVLDEPTAALDAENELRIFQQFRELIADKTAILISHRFSTVRMADRIFVIENGGISEQGPHAELLAQGGTYARLFTLQAESYR
ncbi:MAG: ABC transporter ATP-binding protein/permease [Caldilineaceae bacterium]|nr:ABC transporter ATP-binding protein/permease [Caldilineaceae bacterium]